MREKDPWRAHVEDLLRQAQAKQKVWFQPTGERLLLFPVRPDEQRVIEVVELQKHLPDMGLVLAVGFEANLEATNLLEAVYGEDPVPPDVRHSALYSPGDVVCLNRFSGMGVPGTELLVVRTEDVYGKLSGLALRLATSRERASEGFEDTLAKRQSVIERPVPVGIPTGGPLIRG